MVPARLWLDSQLIRFGIQPVNILGYNDEALTHTEVADAIQQGRAQVGLGIHAAAVSHHLDFIPLFQERYDLVLSKEQLSDQQLSPYLTSFTVVNFATLSKVLLVTISPI